MNIRLLILVPLMACLPGTHLLGYEHNGESLTPKIRAIFNQGYAPTPQDEQHIRAILKRVGVNHLVREIKITSDKEINNYDMQIVKINGIFNLLIEKTLIDKGLNDEFDFLLGHEAAHIALAHLTHNHTALLPKEEQPRADRIQEYEADIFSAQKLKLAQAGINFCARFVETMPHFSTELTSYDGNASDDNPQDPHPHNKTRIRYLMPLARLQRA